MWEDPAFLHSLKRKVLDVRKEIFGWRRCSSLIMTLCLIFVFGLSACGVTPQSSDKLLSTKASKPSPAATKALPRWQIVPTVNPKDPTGLNTMADVAAVSATNVWAIGDFIQHWDGRRWSLVSDPLPSSTTTLQGIGVVFRLTSGLLGAKLLIGMGEDGVSFPALMLQEDF
jgi:hypothetical protein